MATVYADINGKILVVMDNYNMLTQFYPTAPVAGTVTTLDFDEATNSALLADLKTNGSLYSLTGGATPQLSKSGTGVVAVVNIAGASAAWQAAIAALNNITPDQIRQALTLLNAGTATLAQTEKAVYFVLLKLAIRGMLF